MGCSGVLWPPGGEEQKDRGQAALSPQPREGSRVLFILPKTSLECLLGNKGAGAAPPTPHSARLAPESLVEGLPEGGGCYRTALGGLGKLLPEAQGRIRSERSLGRKWGCGTSWGAGPGPGQDGVKGCPPPGPRPLVVSVQAAQPSSHVVGGQPPGLAQEGLGVRRSCRGRPGEAGAQAPSEVGL